MAQLHIARSHKHHLATQRQRGFTIVELLIVIVVIAILAAISIVAYTGVQNRAHDSAIQSDLRQLAQQIQLYEAEHGVAPALGTEVAATWQHFPGIKFRATQAAYEETGYNLYVCRSRTGGPFGIGAMSKSGDVIAYRSDRGFFEYSGSWGASGTNCPNLIGASSFYYGVGRSNGGTWQAWAGGSS